jgi:RHS repeat-associated protein
MLRDKRWRWLLTLKQWDGYGAPAYGFVPSGIPKVCRLSLTSYTYDSRDQLIKEELSDGTSVSYEYDNAGNRRKKVQIKDGRAETINYTYNKGNQLMTTDNESFTYDFNGNLIKDTKNTYIYNEFDQLIEVKNLNNETIFSADYDEQGKRIRTNINGVSRNYFYEDNHVIFETDDNNNIIVEYTWDENDSPVSMTKDGQTYYYVLNAHGDVISMTDSNGNSVADYQYDAWGNVVYQSGAMADTNPYRYTSYRYDNVLDLYYLMARYYDSKTGRFISADTFKGYENKPLSQNLYIYTYNNPVKYYDESGHFVFLIPLIGWALAAAVAALVEWAIAASAITLVIVESAKVTSTLIDKFKKKNPTVIYRGGNGNGTNLTPRTTDVGGLSYYRKQPASGEYTATTLEAVKATGKLTAVIDNVNHVSVRPVNMSKLQEWMNTRPSANSHPHSYTKILQALSVKVRK